MAHIKSEKIGVEERADAGLGVLGAGDDAGEIDAVEAGVEARREAAGVMPGWAKAAVEPAVEAAKRKRGERGPGRIRLIGEAFERWMADEGMTDPLVFNARLVSADPVALQAYFAENELVGRKEVDGVVNKANVVLPTLDEIMKLQQRSSEILAPYLHRKKPIDIVIEHEQLPVLIINAGTNQLDQAREVARVIERDGGMMINISPEKETNEINGLTIGRLDVASNKAKEKAK
jgi:hypothetical protein